MPIPDPEIALFANVQAATAITPGLLESGRVPGSPLLRYGGLPVPPVLPLTDDQMHRHQLSVSVASSRCELAPDATCFSLHLGVTSCLRRGFSLDGHCASGIARAGSANCILSLRAESRDPIIELVHR